MGVVVVVQLFFMPMSTILWAVAALFVGLFCLSVHTFAHQCMRAYGRRHS